MTAGAEGRGRTEGWAGLGAGEASGTGLGGAASGGSTRGRARGFCAASPRAGESPAAGFAARGSPREGVTWGPAARAWLGAPSSNDDGRAKESSAWNTSMNGGPCGPKVALNRNMRALAWSARDTRTEDGLTFVGRGLERLGTGSAR